MSDLTYSVYLFHNWAWDYIAIPFKAMGLRGMWEQAAITMTLLGFCYVMHRTIEMYGIRLGYPVLNLIRRIMVRNPLLSLRPGVTATSPQS